MLSTADIEKLVREKIEREEKPGESAGGSGHLGNVDYRIESIEKPVPVKGGFRIKYRYTRIITTEFTFEPDNPPYQVPLEGCLIIDKISFNE
jgi:hypothetical protein